MKLSFRGSLLVAAIVAAACSGTPNPQDVAGTDASDDTTTPDVATMDSAAESGRGDADSGGGDSQSVWPDAGGITPPDWVPLTVGAAGSCRAFTACGGNVIGAWDVHGGCFEIDIESAVASCPGARVTMRTGRGRGRVVFGADGFAHRVADSEVDVSMVVPEICARFFSCAMLQGVLSRTFTQGACTTAANGDCNCTARQVTHIDHSDAYRVEANEIVSVSSGKRWEFCIQSNLLSYRDTSPTGPREPGTVELQRR